MTEPDRPRRFRRRAVTLGSQRQLAREAGEPLAAIAARLNIPRTTLSGWAKADGFCASDLKAKAEAETETDRVRRARGGALLDAGLIPEAEADTRGARRLQSLISFAAPVTHGLNAAHEAGQEARAYAFEWRLMLKVCEAWYDGLRDMEPVCDGSMRFDSMYIHRCWMVRDVNLALFGPDPEYEALVMKDIYLRAKEGWFIGFRGHIREAVGLLRGMGNDTLADTLEGELAAEAMALQAIRGA